MNRDKADLEEDPGDSGYKCPLCLMILSSKASYARHRPHINVEEIEDKLVYSLIVNKTFEKSDLEESFHHMSLDNDKMIPLTCR
jgi:hypothetical protein